MRGVLGGGPPVPGAYLTFRDAPFGSADDDTTIKMALSPKPSPARRSLESSPAASPVGATTGDGEVKTDELVVATAGAVGLAGSAGAAGTAAMVAVAVVEVEPTNAGAGQAPVLGGDGAAVGGNLFGSPTRKLGPTSVFTKSVIFRDVNAAITSDASADRQFGNPVDVFLDHQHGYTTTMLLP